jgi:hypothetical protein
VFGVQRAIKVRGDELDGQLAVEGDSGGELHREVVRLLVCIFLKKRH